MRPLVLVGAGGFARETAEAVWAINDAWPTWDLLGFLDDAEERHGRIIDGLRVLGPIAMATDLDAQIVVCTGNPGNYTSRPTLVARLGLAAERYATIIHPSAALARSTDVGVGSVLLAGTIATARVVVGDHVAVMPGVVLTHDDVVEDYATIGSGVRLGGGVKICRGAYIGAGALIRENLTIGAGSLIGMGAVTLTDVPPAEVWTGIPATRLRAAAPAMAVSR